MKKLLLLFFLSSVCFSCSAQKIEQVPVYMVNAWVQNIHEDVTIIQPNDSRYNFQVASDSTLIKDKEYVFWIEITDCHDCRTKIAVVVDKAFTTGQMQRDQAVISKKLQHRKIISYSGRFK